MTRCCDSSVCGTHQGQVKWFNDRKGFGFITVLTPLDEATLGRLAQVSDTEGETNSSGTDVFVHQTNINPAVSEYRTLSTGEYVSFDISSDDKIQALNVKGICGGSLQCDIPRRGPRNGGNRGRRTNGGRSGEAQVSN